MPETSLKTNAETLAASTDDFNFSESGGSWSLETTRESQLHAGGAEVHVLEASGENYRHYKYPLGHSGDAELEDVLKEGARDSTRSFENWTAAELGSEHLAETVQEPAAEVEESAQVQSLTPAPTLHDTILSRLQEAAEVSVEESTDGYTATFSNGPWEHSFSRSDFNGYSYSKTMRGRTHTQVNGKDGVVAFEEATGLELTAPEKVPVTAQILLTYTGEMPREKARECAARLASDVASAANFSLFGFEFNSWDHDWEEGEASEAPSSEVL